MYTHYAIEIQTNAEGPDALVAYGYDNQGDAEGKYLALREYGRQSNVLQFTAALMDNRGNVIEKKTYTHAQPAPETEG